MFPEVRLSKNSSSSGEKTVDNNLLAATKSIAPNSPESIALLKRVIAVKMDYARKLALASDLSEATALQFAYCRSQVEITTDLIRIVSDSGS